MNESALMPLAGAASEYLTLRTDGLCRSCRDRCRRYILGTVELCERLYPGAAVITPEMLTVIEQKRRHLKSRNEDCRWERENRKFAEWIRNGYGELPDLHVKETIPWEQRLHSSMAALITEFVRRKRSAGVEYSMPYALIWFDAMLAAEFPEATTVTREIALRWVEKAQEGGVSINTAIRRTTPVRQFCKYVRSSADPECYVIPSKLPGRQLRYHGHIITEKELRAFFKTADALKHEPNCPYRHLSAPAAFRLMYACGLRVSEIRILKREDVSLETGELKIRESKAHAVRTVVMHQDMLDVMRHYDAEIEKTLPGREWFFADRPDGSQMGRHKPGSWFRLIWGSMETDEEIKEPAATARDFRHLYALTVISRWYRGGEDLNALEPWLVCYMGHSDFEMTSYYIHLEGSFAPDFEKLSARATGDLFDDFDENALSGEVPYDR